MLKNKKSEDFRSFYAPSKAYKLKCYASLISNAIKINKKMSAGRVEKLKKLFLCEGEREREGKKEMDDIVPRFAAAAETESQKDDWRGVNFLIKLYCTTFSEAEREN
jgi:hypothetical protein